MIKPLSEDAREFIVRFCTEGKLGSPGLAEIFLCYEATCKALEERIDRYEADLEAIMDNQV